jgi:hypothetical protein
LLSNDKNGFCDESGEMKKQNECGAEFEVFIDALVHVNFTGWSFLCSAVVICRDLGFLIMLPSATSWASAQLKLETGLLCQ